MTKKILALALAGTTAFSVFASALSVNATAPTNAEVPTNSGYKPVQFSTTTGTITVTNAPATITDDTITDVDSDTFTSTEGNVASFATDLAKYTPLYTFVKLVDTISGDLAGTGDEVKSDKIYLYDWVFGSTSTAKVFEAITAFTGAYDAATTATTKTFALLTNVETAEDALWVILNTQTSPDGYNSTRQDVTNDFKSTLDSIKPADDYDISGTTLSNYTTLYGVITGMKNTYTSYQNSVLIYLMNKLEKTVEDFSDADVTVPQERISYYTDILDARVAEDYKNSYDYNTFLREYQKLQADNASTSTFNGLTDYADDLFTLIKRNTGTAATSDKAELKDLLADAKAIRSSSEYPSGPAKDTLSDIIDDADEIVALPSARSYPSTLAAYVELLSNAMSEVAPSSSASNWLWIRLETAINAAEEMVETDYTASAWKSLTNALARAQKVLDSANASPSVVEGACDTLETALKATPKKPTAAKRNELKAALQDAKKALSALGNNATGAQAIALNKAIVAAEGMFTSNTYTDTKPGTLISAVDAAIADLNAAMTTASLPMGWYTDADGNDRYGTADGDYTDGWEKIDGLWFFFKEGVALKSQWVEADGKWSWVGSNCVCYRASWIPFEGNYYYVDQNGYMLDSEWLGWNGNWYWLDKGGRMATGWRTIGDKQYYFGSDGAMLTNTTTPDGYKVGIDGAYIEA